MPLVSAPAYQGSGDETIDAPLRRSVEGKLCVEIVKGFLMFGKGT